ncbi:MAG TPA: carbohydrate ABC transporter permease [Candidatus Brocadiia bacterium]|nr:carbohydrate ABC transporter permease [Candidatus Brocadiia bacterium]
MARPSSVTAGGRLTAHLLLFAFFVLAVFPMVWMTFTGMKTREEFTRSIWAPPGGLRLDSFRAILSEPGFRRYYVNNAIVTLGAIALTLAVSAPAAFALGCLRFRGEKTVSIVIVAGLILPVHVTLIPLLKLLGGIGLYDTLSGLIMVHAAFSIPVSVVILRAFFHEIPPAIPDAARVDGCSTIQILLHIMLPLARPALFTVGVFLFVNIWNEFVFALTFLTSPEKKTLPLGLMEFAESHGTDVVSSCAAMTLGAAPLMIVYFLAQKHIVRGLTAGAVSG